MTYTILVSDSKVIDLESGRSAFDDVDADVRVTEARQPDELRDAAAGVDALIVDASTQVSESVLESLDDLQVVGRSGIGVDNIDVGAASERGVSVVNVPEYCLDEVSAHALGMLLALARKLPQLDAAVKRGEWDWSVAQPIARLSEQTVGIVGFGKIGRSLARKLRGLAVEVLVFDPYVSATDLAGFDVRRVEWPRILTDSDFITIHVPLTGETRNLFDAEAFQMMPDDAVLINTSRGPVVDEGALVDALQSDRLSGAGLDVRDPEPPTDSPLHELENVILTPHAGFYSERARRELTRTVCADIVRVLRGRAPRNPVEPGRGW